MPGPIPADDPSRRLTHARPDQDQELPHIGLVGDTYTILVGGDDTAGRYTLIDMHVPPGGGPPPHRHDFEEMFSVLDGAVEVTFRGETRTVRAGETVNVPANAPHAFRNLGEAPADCCASVSPPVRTSSSRSWASPWTRGPPHRHRSTRRPRRTSGPGRSRWLRASAPSCCPHLAATDRPHP